MPRTSDYIGRLTAYMQSFNTEAKAVPTYVVAETLRIEKTTAHNLLNRHPEIFTRTNAFGTARWYWDPKTSSKTNRPSKANPIAEAINSGVLSASTGAVAGTSAANELPTLPANNRWRWMSEETTARIAGYSNEELVEKLAMVNTAIPGFGPVTAENYILIHETLIERGVS